MPAVSVVVPTYDRMAMLAEALASVAGQTFRDFEVIVVDDGSRDATFQLVRSYPQARYLRLAQRGVAAARNAGIDAAKGDWIAFLDSDDLWLSHKLSAQLRFFRTSSCFAVCQTEEIWVRDGRRINPRRYHRKPSGRILKPSLRRCLISPSAVMLDRSVFRVAGLFDTSLPVCEDYDLWLRVAANFHVGLVSEPLVIKRGGHADQLSKRYWGMDRFRVASLCRLLASDMLEGEEREEAARVLAEKAAILARGAAKRGRGEEAGRYLALVSWAIGTLREGETWMLGARSQISPSAGV